MAPVSTELVHFIIKKRGNIRKLEDPRAAEWFGFFDSMAVFGICWNVQFIGVISCWPWYASAVPSLLCIRYICGKEFLV